LPRPDWKQYFLDIAEPVKARGECKRSLVGAVLTRIGEDGLPRIVATGYNGVEAGLPSCLDGVCPREQMGAAPGTLYAEAPCIATHAEVNAVNDALRRGLPVRGCTLYVTKEPCEVCAGLLRDWGVSVVWQDRRRGTRGELHHGPTISSVSASANDRF
jgi:dCMP deaminase